MAPFNIFYRTRRIPVPRAIYSPPDPPPLRQTSSPSPFVPRRVVRVRVFESPFTARLAKGRGVNEEPQVARKGRPFSPPVVTQSAGRPTWPSPATFTELRVFLPTLHSIYTRGVGEGPISHGRLELRPYATGISRVPERDG